MKLARVSQTEYTYDGRTLENELMWSSILLLLLLFTGAGNSSARLCTKNGSWPANFSANLGGSLRARRLTDFQRRGHGDTQSAQKKQSSPRLFVQSPSAAQQRPRTVGAGELRKIVLSGHKKSVTMIAFARDGRVVATGSDDRTVKLWDASSGDLLTTLTLRDGDLYDFRFSPDGKTLATLTEDKKPRVWNVATGQLEATLVGHSGKIRNLEFSPDGQLIVTGSDDGTAKVWEVATGAPRATLKVTRFSSRWMRRLSGNIDDLFVYPTGYFSPDGKTILTISGDRTPKLWDTATGKLRAILDHKTGASSAVFSRDGRWVATESYDDNVRIWETATGQLKSLMVGHTSTIYDLSFSPDGRTLVTGSRDRTAIVWDTKTGRVKYRLEGFDGRVPRVAYSPDGKLVAAKGGYNHHVVKLWNVSTAELLFTLPLPGKKDDIEEIAFSPDGPELITSSDDTVLLWNTKNGQLVARLEDCRHPAVFSPDGNQVATRGPNNTAVLWDVPIQ